MAVLITASEDSGINLANVVFESVRDCVSEITEDDILLNLLEEAQYVYLLDLTKLTRNQREIFTQALSRLKEQVSKRDGIHPGFFEHLEKVKHYVLE